MVSRPVTFKNMAEELGSYKQSKEMLDAVIDSSFDGLWICDGAGKVVRINKACESQIGMKARDVEGKNVRELVSEGVFDKSVTLEVLKRKASVTMIQHTRNEKTLLVTATPVFDADGEVAFVVANDRDITELKRLRDQLEESQALTKRYWSELSDIHLKDLGKESLVVHSKAMKRILETALRIARVDSTVLITGESGVGKSMLAKLIHKNSDRAKGPFIRVNCGAIPESLVESELFGYERGAFTGAKVEGKPGFFEIAHSGTLFLDEIGEVPLNVQVKLLRFLEGNEIVRVGGVSERKIDVRVIAASNRNLEEMASQKEFRKDLFYRLNVLPIEIPPLNQRKEDIVPLVHFFLKKFNTQYKKATTISSEALDALHHYQFGGNVRELSNLIERLVVLSEDTRIELGDLPIKVKEAVNSSAYWLIQHEGFCLREAVERLEAALVKDALLKARTQDGAAKLLGVNQSTIARKAKQYRIILSNIILHNREPLP